MEKYPVCDFCGRPATIIQNQYLYGQRVLEIDEDGLWVCSECKSRIIRNSTDDIESDNNDLDALIKALVGKSAGAICFTLDLPYVPHYQSIIDAASKIAYDEDRYMSTWLFVTQWADGTTVWECEDRSARALVFPEGDIQIEPRI